MSSDLDFAVDLTGVDPDALLRDATRRVDLLEGHLADEGVTEPGEAGTLLRDMDKDVAEFADFPVVYPITAEDYIARDGKVPAGFTQLAANNRFYRIEFPVNLFPRSSWSFDRLEVRLDFNAGDQPSNRPKAFQILPSRQLAELAGWKYEVDVSLDANLTLQVALPKPANVQLPVGGGAGAQAKAGLGLVLGPFEYKLKRMVIQTTPPGLEKVFWRLEDAKLLQQDTPRFIVIAQVPMSAATVRVDGVLQAHRNYNFLTAYVRNTFRELPEAIRNYFKNGAPKPQMVTYDLTAQCVPSGN